MKYSPTFATKLNNEDLESFLYSQTKKKNFEFIWELAEGFYENLVNVFSEANAKYQSDFKDLPAYDLFNNFLIAKQDDIQELINNKYAEPNKKIESFDRKSEKLVAFILCGASPEAASCFTIPTQMMAKSLVSYDATSNEYLPFGVDTNAWNKFNWLKLNIFNAHQQISDPKEPYNQVLNFYKNLMENIEQEKNEGVLFSKKGWENIELFEFRNTDLLSTISLIPIRDLLLSFMDSTFVHQNKIWSESPDLLKDVSWSEKNAFLCSFLNESKLETCVHIFKSVDVEAQKVLAFSQIIKEMYSKNSLKKNIKEDVLELVKNSNIGEKIGFSNFLKMVELHWEKTQYPNIKTFFYKYIDIDDFKKLDESLLKKSIGMTNKQLKFHRF